MAGLAWFEDGWILGTRGLRRAQASPRMTPVYSVGGKTLASSPVLAAAGLVARGTEQSGAPEVWPSRRGFPSKRNPACRPAGTFSFFRWIDELPLDLYVELRRF